jgi:hypothetical protein
VIDPNLSSTLSAIAQVLTALGVIVTAVMGFINGRRLKQVALQTDGLTQELVGQQRVIGEQTTAAAIAEGELKAVAVKSEGAIVTAAAVIAGHAAGKAAQKLESAQLRRAGDIPRK